MRCFLLYLGIIAILTMGGTLRAQDATDCSSLMKFGIYDKYKTLATETQFNQVTQSYRSDR